MNFRRVSFIKPPGKYLRKEREFRNLSIEEATKLTKIRGHLLTAIEEDRYEMLPPGLYLRGFLVAYAKYLGLDPNDVLLRYKKYLEELNIFKEEPLEPKKLEPPKHALFPNKRATLYLLLVILFTVTLFATFLITYLPQLSFPAVPGQKEPMLARIPSRSHMPEEGTTQIEMPESKKIGVGDTIGRDCPIFEVIKAEI